MPLEPGQSISHYRIDQKIGEGGMGIVYVAVDTRLGRRVALKVLPAEMSADAARRARFEREARAIAALNHPNIVTIHSVEEADGTCFLTMELVSGQSLTHVMTRDGLPLARMLDLSIGIADALVAAHHQGIVHRDLKPDNIMVTSEGRIKVLDFGLAKLREAALEGLDTVLPTTSITEEGRIVGTVSYMSPEQAEGKSLDHRSDIFSFGVVLYEMATGKRPFRGDTAISTISSILKDTPPAPQQLNTSIPPELGRIVKRCLTKELERRYQSTEDLRNELRELKEESDSGELSAERAAPGIAIPRPRADLPTLRRPATWALAVLLVVFAVGAGWFLRHRQAAPAPTSTMQAAMTMSRATRDGKVGEAAISPDGRYLAYIRTDGTKYSLRLRQIVTGDEVQVVAPTEATLASPAFSADGDFLNYVSIDVGRTGGWASRVSVLGGMPRRIVDGVWGVAASPDGRMLALTGGTVDRSFVRVAGSEGDAPRELTFRKGQDHFDSNPAWSSDGRTLAIISHRFGEPQQLVLIDVATGRETPVPIPSLRSLTDATWIPGKSALVVSGSDRPVNQRGPSQISEVTTSGELQGLTHDLNSYRQITMTADGSTLAAVQVEIQTGIDVASVHDGVPGPFTELLPVSSTRPGGWGIAWLDGHRLAHSMLQGDAAQIFVTDTTSKSTRILTSGPAHQFPSASRDGRTMVVIRTDADRNHIYRIDPETGAEQALTDGQFDNNPVVSPDGRWVVYSATGDVLTLMKVAITGGAPVVLTQQGTYPFGITPDNRDVLVLEFGASDTVKGMFIPLAGGPSRPIPGYPPAATAFQLAPDSRSMTYLISREGAPELWSLPLSGGESKRLARLEGKEISGFAWSPDGTRLAIIKTSRSGDVVLMKRNRS